jgi:hypothetical protein
MAIGFPPLIPLDRVVPDPGARFERFGVDNLQLFGKPLDTTVPDYQPSAPTWDNPGYYEPVVQTLAIGSGAPILNTSYTSQAVATTAAGTGAQVDVTA